MPRKTKVGHLQPCINVADFKALQEFEHICPEFYGDNYKVAATTLSNVAAMRVQANAFNDIFNSPVWGDEFKAMIEKYAAA